MAFTQADVDKLKTAIASGVRRVRFSDRELEYQSLEDMREALAMMERELNPTRPRTRYGTVDKMGPSDE